MQIRSLGSGMVLSATALVALLPSTSDASTGRTFRRVYEFLGPTGSMIALGIFVVLVILGLSQKANTGKSFARKQALLAEWLNDGADKDGPSAVKTLAELFLMGPVEFNVEQAAHNAKVLTLLEERVDEQRRQKLSEYRRRFEQVPAKFGILESSDMEKFVAALAK